MRTVIRGRLGRLVKECGGVDKLAKRAKVSPVTVWRWSKENRWPTERVRVRVNTIALILGLALPFPNARRSR